MISRTLRILWWISLCYFPIYLALVSYLDNHPPCSESFSISLSDTTAPKEAFVRFCETSEVGIGATVESNGSADSTFSYTGMFELSLTDHKGVVRWTHRYDFKEAVARNQGDTPTYLRFGDDAPIDAWPWEYSVIAARVIRPDTSHREMEAVVDVGNPYWFLEDPMEKSGALALALIVLIPLGRVLFRKGSGETSALTGEPARGKIPLLALARMSIASPFYGALALIPLGIVLVALLGAVLSGGGHGSNAYAAVGAVFTAAVIVPQFLVLGLGCTMFCRPFHLSRGSAFLAGLRVFGFSLVIAVAVSMVLAGAGGPPLLVASPIFWTAAFGLGKRASSQ